MANGAPGAGAPQAKKGIPVLGWIAIGCGGLVVLAAIAFTVLGWFAVHKVKDVASDFEENPSRAAAELAVKFNPDLELVASDDEAGTLTVRQKSTGKVVTVDYKDIEEGHISFESDEGRVEISGAGQGDRGVMTVTTDKGSAQFGQAGEIPDWIPVHPSTTAREALYKAAGPSGQGGHVAFTVDAGAEEVASFYQRKLQEEGYVVSMTTLSGGAGSGAVVTGHKGSRSIVATVSAKGSQTEVAVQYALGS